MIKEIDSRFLEWADWAIRRDDGGIGYRNRTIESELMEMGPNLIKGKGLRVPVVHERAEEIEKIVSSMPKKLRNVIIIKYILTGTDEIKARQNGFSYSTFRRHVDRAHEYTDKCLQENKSTSDLTSIEQYVYSIL